MNPQKQILYVEDMPQNVLLIRRILEAEGHRLIAANTATEGWQKAIELQPDLILMDLHLPGEMSGLELTSRLKENELLTHIPIIALTAFGHTNVEQQALAAGCDGFLRKPADIHQIRRVIHHFLQEATPNFYTEKTLQTFTHVY